jgi:ATP-dependent DNA helicase PIF1
MKLNKLQQEVITNLIEGTNTIMVGKAGTGKTFIINELTRICETEGIALVKMASTGVAAQHIEGTTLHSAMALGIEPMLRKTHKWPRSVEIISEGVRSIIESYDKTIMVVDEVSMIRADIMDAFLDKVANIHYGDITILLSGDTAQLQPVSVITQKAIDEDAEAQSRLMTAMDVAYGSSAPYFFKANLIKQFNFKKVELMEVYRQKDQASINALNIIRSPKATERRTVINWVSKAERRIPLALIKNSALVVSPTNKGAQQYNDMKLAELKGKMWHYDVPENIKMGRSLFQRNIVLKEGATVMVISNIPDQNLWNGQRGVVRELYKHGALVQFKSGLKMITKEEYGHPSYGMDKDGKIKLLYEHKFTQLPLVLGWAVTVNKSQGSQAKYVHLLNREPLTGKRIRLFGKGMLYVAASRCTNLRNFTVSESILETDFSVGISDFEI